ncbi:MAG TPA: metallophosphoesterase [Candidatus Altiarchaeales archaeon]|nr:metallophosphoesterase [Candidatus Altiarchaeales archaeon]
MSLVAFISDTHDNLPNVRRIVEDVNRRGVKLVVFLGDLCSPFTVGELEKIKAPLKGVFGNCDGARESINKRLEGMGVQFTDFLEFDFDGISFCAYHGTDRKRLGEIVSSGKYKVVASGHTHEPLVQEDNGVLTVNPGEACGYITGRATYLLFDTESIQAEVVDL